VLEEERFAQLQTRLRDLWPTMTTRSAPANRTVIVLHSLGVELPPHLQHVIPAYEERFLCAIMSLLRQPDGHVIYVTSVPMLPRLVDYYFDLVPSADRADARSRLQFLSVGDGSSRPLTEKVLERPRMIERIRRLLPNPERALILPFMCGPAEVQLALRLDVALYGAPLQLRRFGTKVGGRELFEQEGVPHAPGVNGVHSVDDVVDAIRQLRASDHQTTEVIVKMDSGVGGLGNGIVRLAGADDAKDIAGRVRAVQPDETDLLPEAFLEQLDQQGGVVELRLSGAEFQSPSVQMRSGPSGEFELLSTHDQILGGANGMTFLGCRFPAHATYRQIITAEAVKIGRRLTREGMLGRFSVDFVVVRQSAGGWHPYAIEINLRSGGTTHPMLAMLSLTDGMYDETTGDFIAVDGRQRSYVASDHVESSAYHALTPDDLLDLAETTLRWDSERMSGTVFHLVSAIAAGGRTGVTAIDESASGAERRFRAVSTALDEAVRSVTVPGATSRPAGFAE
jgi:hypothetical protein